MSPGNPATDFVTTSVSRLDARAARVWLDARGSAANKHHVLIFVHEYNNRFSDAVFRAVQLVHDSGAQVTPILFTWPSRGSVFAYGYDRESANLSRDAAAASWISSARSKQFLSQGLLEEKAA
jgi:esterase/lipase superfamily enzyme